MNIVLIAGLWLDGASWAPVTRRLEEAGHTVQALTLPGLESAAADRAGITLVDHVGAVVAAIDAADGPSMLVGHSASATLACCAADVRPEKVRRLVYVGGFPGEDGTPFMSGLPVDGDDVPFPGWAAFEGPDSADIDEPTKARLLEQFIPSPAGVLSDIVHLNDERRLGIPVTAICPEYSPEDLRGWMAAGDLPELSRATNLEMVDIDSGHWPQVTAPDRLAELILAEVQR